MFPCKSSGSLKLMLAVSRRTKDHAVHQYLNMLSAGLFVAGSEFQITFISELKLGGKSEDILHAGKSVTDL
ncbi:hypothetical protein P3L10_016800 [Capsicum annuum]